MNIIESVQDGFGQFWIMVQQPGRSGFAVAVVIGMVVWFGLRRRKPQAAPLKDAAREPAE